MSLRRIGRLFTPYRWPLAVVTAIIVVSSIVGLASPFLLRAVIDTALPAKNVRACWRGWWPAWSPSPAFPRLSG